jgi:3-oxoacyl-[acyl-carrier protein] reductase
MRLRDRVAVVTGGASGFGEAIARRFAQEGARVVVGDLAEEAGARVAAEIGGAFVQADVSRGADVAALVERAREMGGPHVVVSNAGYSHRNRPMLEVEEAEFDRIFAVNVKAIFHMAHAAVPPMREAGGGVMLNVASTAGVRPRPGLTWYNGSKGAAITLTRSMAVELAPDGIRVCALNPVAGDTPMLATFLGEDTPERREAFRATVPLGRLSQPTDVAAAALFLASDEAAFLTGVCLEVDGGRCV